MFINDKEVIILAFISLVFAFLIVFAIVIAAGIISVIAGTVLYHKTKYKKTGVALRISGYILTVPAILIILTAVTISVFT